MDDELDEVNLGDDDEFDEQELEAVVEENFEDGQEVDEFGEPIEGDDDSDGDFDDDEADDAKEDL